MFPQQAETVAADPSDDPAALRTRLVALEAAVASLRHDLRGMLAPALLVADRLIGHQDPKVVRAGETVVKSVRRAEARLLETRGLSPE